ncbi:uncharacterized protein LOC132712559 [Pantherophis guttatus]|uniref:Uncharacterized protein LOC132712559 n=1 Tax=Pantherophis guttatus TaxID=94885 RepID=A0ABM3ZPU4_PANGU|nr:uncharacterized protein LOC132712559 [Pantherophis guttatus]
MMRCLLEVGNLSIPYWGKTIKYANYIVNRTCSVINQTPFFMLYGYKPDLKHLRIFGSYAMVNIPLAQRRKGGPAAKRLRFMGIDDNSKWSKFIDSKHVIVISQSTNFEEDADWSRIHSNDPAVYFPRDAADATKYDDQDLQANVPATSSSQPDVPSSQAANGLKQSGLMWYLCLTDKLNSMGFIKSETDECVFTKRSDNIYEIVLVYVDIVYIDPNKRMSENFAKALQRYFTLKFLGYVNTYLGVQVVKTQKGFSLSQENKIKQILHHCNMKDANTVRIPMQTDFHNLAHEPSPEFEDQTLLSFSYWVTVVY